MSGRLPKEIKLSCRVRSHQLQPHLAWRWHYLPAPTRMTPASAHWVVAYLGQALVLLSAAWQGADAAPPPAR